METKLIKVACYCRVSTKSEEQEQSFEAQQAYFKEKLSEKNNFELVEIYADRGTSGTDFHKREAFNRMLEDCGIIKKEVKVRETEIRKKYISIDYVVDADITPKFNLIYVKDSSRFARNTEVSRIITRLRDKGVYVYFEDLNKSTENQSEKMLLDFMFSMAEQESISRSDKVRFGNMQSAKEGTVRSMKLYGYTYIKEENSLRIIPEEAEIVKLIFDLRLQGYGGRAIATELDQRGIKNRKGNGWRGNTINSMLQNLVYCGKVVRNKWYSSRMYGKDIVELNTRDKWIVEDSEKVDKIIDEENFEKVQIMIEDNRQKVGRVQGKYHGRSEFAEKIKCEKCGKYYVRNTDRGRVFYNCSTKKQHGTKNCNNRNVQEYEIEALIDPYLISGEYKKITKKYIDMMIEKEKEKKATLYMSTNIEEVNQINMEIAEYKKKLSKLTEAFLDDDSEGANDIFKSKKTELSEKIKALEIKRNKLSATDEEKKDMLQSMDIFINYLQEQYNKCPEDITREEFINEYLYEIRVSENGALKLITQSENGYYKIIELMNED
jgi:Site-specific recombinases, DNA invertase Pin homologs